MAKIAMKDLLRMYSRSAHADDIGNVFIGSVTDTKSSVLAAAGDYFGDVWKEISRTTDNSDRIIVFLKTGDNDAYDMFTVYWDAPNNRTRAKTPYA